MQVIDQSRFKDRGNTYDLVMNKATCIVREGRNWWWPSLETVRMGKKQWFPPPPPWHLGMSFSPFGHCVCIILINLTGGWKLINFIFLNHTFPWGLEIILRRPLTPVHEPLIACVDFPPWLCRPTIPFLGIVTLWQAAGLMSENGTGGTVFCRIWGMWYSFFSGRSQSWPDWPNVSPSPDDSPPSQKESKWKIMHLNYLWAS